jgi:hypothetical protein
MSKFTSPLDHIKVAAPCSADWDQMYAVENQRVRFCSQCNLNVYNLSGMTRAQAEALLTHSEQRLCVRFYRRPDGTILTQNCPVGLRAIKRRLAWLGQLIQGMVISLLFVLGLQGLSLAKKHLDAKLSLPIDLPPDPGIIMGDIAPKIELEDKPLPSPIPAIDR